MTYLRGGFVYPHRLYLQRGGRQIAAPTDALIGGTIHPHGLYPERPRNGTQAVPYGFAGGWILSSARVVFVTLLGDESSPLHCVIPFNHTGYIRYIPYGFADRHFLNKRISKAETFVAQ